LDPGVISDLVVVVLRWWACA